MLRPGAGTAVRTGVASFIRDAGGDYMTALLRKLGSVSVAFKVQPQR